MYKQFIRQLKIKNPSKYTLKSVEHVINSTQKYLGKTLESATWDEILNYIEYLQNNGLAISTVALHKTKIRQFYNFCYDETENLEYRRIAKKLRCTIPKRTLNPQNILLPEDVKRLINASTLERDRCLAASFFEGGMRVGEFTALKNSMVFIKEETQEVIFNIPNTEGCKTGARSVVCLEIYGYVQDWLKCSPDLSPDAPFIDITDSGITSVFERLARKAHIKKPCNPHMFRHASITHAVSIGMQESAIKQRFWGNLDTAMLSTYITLSEQLQAQAYRNAKGMGTEAKVINPLAVRCVQCGRLIQAGDLCAQCKDNKQLKERVMKLESAHTEISQLLSQKEVIDFFKTLNTQR